ncbi:MAG: hypothetical protein JXA54_16135 [Candidatus Heimdallarchaeota archaeon]|nr:hypothetical protein [Candidatus Heimdallarchaeota archaeon]
MFTLGLNSRKWLNQAQKTEKETKKYNKILYNTWSKISKNFDISINEFKNKNVDTLPEFEKSLVYMEMLAFIKRFGNVQNLASWGYYHSALLELRFMLETTILAYYLDQQLPNTDQTGKIKLMQKHKGELWGSRLRRRAYTYEKDFGDEIEKVISSINNSIDEYMADRTVDDWKLTSLPFSEKDFMECVNHSKNASSLIIKHFIKCFPSFTYNDELFVILKDEQKNLPLQNEDTG